MNDELKHYGVLGMKWGVIRSNRKTKANKRLERRALNLDRKSSEFYKKSEKVHAKQDLEESNRAAAKSADYAKKICQTSKEST